jgi:hypothetical protein
MAKPHSIAPNAPDPDGLVVFPVHENGDLSDALFQDAGGASPWCPLFLKHRTNRFVIGYAVSDGVSLATLDSNGKISTGPAVQCDTSQGRPSELCWMAITLDDRLVFATMTGYGYVTSWRLDGNVLFDCERSGVPEGSGRRHLQGTCWRRQQRTERHLAYTGRHLSLPDLRERFETGGLLRPAGWFAQRDHKREYSIQQPAGPDGILIAGHPRLRYRLD